MSVQFFKFTNSKIIELYLLRDDRKKRSNNLGTAVRKLKVDVIIVIILPIVSFSRWFHHSCFLLPFFLALWQMNEIIYGMIKP